MYADGLAFFLFAFYLLCSAESVPRPARHAASRATRRSDGHTAAQPAFTRSRRARDRSRRSIAHTHVLRSCACCFFTSISGCDFDLRHRRRSCRHLAAVQHAELHDELPVEGGNVVNVQRLVWWRNADGQNEKHAWVRGVTRVSCPEKSASNPPIWLTVLLFCIMRSFFLFSVVHSALCSAMTRPPTRPSRLPCATTSA